MKKVDLFVIGAGSGGLAAAKRAASYGAKVMIAESDRVGGTCAIRGCIPKKLMVYASALGKMRRLASDYGWAAAPESFSWPHMCQVRDQVVNNLELAHLRHLAAAKVEHREGRAVVVGPHEVELDGERLRAGHILIATGALPVLPNIPGADVALTSDGFFKLPTMPASAVLIGAGYIAVEFACLLQILGCKTTVIARSQVLRKFDSDLRTGMVEAMRALGIDVREGQSPRALARDATGFRVDVNHASINAQSCILVTVGRRPNTVDLGLESVGVALGENGEVIVDAHHTTSVPSIHAVGDVTDKANLTPVAIKAGRTWADRLFGGLEASMSYDLITTAVFGSPPLATVGLTEEEAIRQLGADGVRIFRTRFIPLLYSTTPTEKKGTAMMKLVVDKQSDRVLGVHMLGDDAPEIIQGFAAALRAGATKSQLDATLALHPTQAEEFVLMR